MSPFCVVEITPFDPELAKSGVKAVVQILLFPVDAEDGVPHAGLLSLLTLALSEEKSDKPRICGIYVRDAAPRIDEIDCDQNGLMGRVMLCESCHSVFESTDPIHINEK